MECVSEYQWHERFSELTTHIQADWLSINQIPVPRLKDNHVLIKVEYAPQVRIFVISHRVSTGRDGDVHGNVIFMMLIVIA